jgi:hypothetical protein
MRGFVAGMLVLLAGCALPVGGGGFLGYPEDRVRRIEEEHPEVDRSLYGIATMTEVQLATYEQYLRAKQEDRIVREERRGGFVYYATEREAKTPAAPETRHSFAEPYFKVTERYKAKLPGTP